MPEAYLCSIARTGEAASLGPSFAVKRNDSTITEPNAVQQEAGGAEERTGMSRFVPRFATTPASAERRSLIVGISGATLWVVFWLLIQLHDSLYRVLFLVPGLR
jgi:hypothetical protein